LFSGVVTTEAERSRQTLLRSLANVPPGGFVSDNPRLTLYWVGDDPDGYVIGYRYTWTFRLSPTSPFERKPYSTILNIGIPKTGGEQFALMTDASPEQLPAVYKFFATLPPEGIDTNSASILDHGGSLTVEGSQVWASNPSTVRYPVHVNPNSGTFIFDSQDTLNPHQFEVAAIDNNGAVDTHPATLTFSTPQVSPPRVKIVDGPTDTVLVRLDTTDTYRGVPFTFLGIDPNSRTVDYSWVVDKDVWSSVSGRTVPWSEFSQNTVVNVTAAAFPPESVYAFKHTLYVRGRNEFGSIDTLGYYVINGDTTFARRDFYTLFPEFLRPGAHPRTLLLNASYNYKDSVGYVYANADTLDNFYRQIFDELGRSGQYDYAHTSTAPIYFPGLAIWGKYSSVFFYADVIYQEGEATLQPEGSHTIEAYVNIGGKMVITAYAMRAEYSEDYMQYVPHCEESARRSPPSAYAYRGAIGQKDYPDIPLDTTKLGPSWHEDGYPLALKSMFAGRPSGFGEIIYQWHDAQPGAFFEGRTIGVRYQGLTYQVIYFGFPLYYSERSAVVQALAKAFDDIGY
jgi:hypothetical protein